MSYVGAPKTVRSLEQRIRNLAGSDDFALLRRINKEPEMVCPMLTVRAIKGGSAIALRYGRNTRLT